VIRYKEDEEKENWKKGLVRPKDRNWFHQGESYFIFEVLTGLGRIEKRITDIKERGKR
jgi:hypothetical protein